MGLRRFERKFGANLYQELPALPGVYLFRDAAGVLLYVGKARNLRRRLQAYRNATRSKAHRKMRIVVRESTTLEVLPQASERDALLLENQIIRVHRPRYNVDGAFFFLYPAVGIWKNDDQTVLCFTTSCEAWSSFPFEWYGTFRSRRRAKEAFDAIVSLLSFIGHLEGKSRLAPFPRLRGSRVVGLRRLDPALVDSLHAFWMGNRRDLLETLALSLLEKIAARRHAPEIQQHLQVADAFYQADIRKLRAAINASGRAVAFVPQHERDAMFLALARPSSQPDEEKTACDSEIQRT